MTEQTVPKWTLNGDWFDICSCDMACPCEFAQAPTGNKCEAVLAYRINTGTFGATDLSGINVVALFRFEGNLWAGETTATVGLLVDDRATPPQEEAIQAIFTGAGGGWPGTFAQLIGDFRGLERARIRIDIEDDLASWAVDIGDKLTGSAQALTGPTADPRKRVQLLNPPGSEVGPGENVIATWGIGNVEQTYDNLFGDMQFTMSHRSSKHIPFAWSGPDA